MLNAVPGEHPLAGPTARRRNAWGDKTEALLYFRSRKTYSTWDDRALKGFLAGGLVPDGRDTAKGQSALRLACNPEFEAQMYRTVEEGLYPRLGEIQCRATIGVGSISTNLQTPELKTHDLYEDICRRLPAGRLVSVPGYGHCFPMEVPAVAAQLIMLESDSDSEVRASLTQPEGAKSLPASKL